MKKHKDGMRAEQIREKLGLQAKEMPRVLKEGLATKLLSKKGQKRATTYLAK
jgi:Fic family protein